jgi:isoleucyl-tRNA synthetase
MDYQKTLNLPQTDFPMKANLVEREPAMIQKWRELGLYELIRAKRKGRDKFILHDGPPYANGNIHLGHALNKILKDIIVKAKTMEGYDSPYVPGWDCHGLPIEHQVVKKLGKKASETSREEIRKLCREYALQFVNIQKEEFQRLGLLGDFDNPYLTMSHEYEARIVEVFGALFEKGYIYRGKKPIYWSWTTVTALAEAEIEYYEVESPSIYVKFPVEPASLPERLPNRDKTFVVIWTTTPWTIPANLGVSFHPEFKYAAYVDGSETYIVAEGLAENFFTKMESKASSVEHLEKEEIARLQVHHPFIQRLSKVLFGNHVTLESGTGIVHTAPGHGQEDYQIGLEYGLEIYCPVDQFGRFTADFPEMEGENVFKANDKIVALLQSKNALLKHEKITHSYPHGWRDKKPVIFRATEQWFFKIDHNQLRENGLQAIRSTKWTPPWGQNRIEGMVHDRPDWCLSRQRAWGVPIPSFRFKETGEIVISTETISHFAGIIRDKGLDSWFTMEAHELLPEKVTVDGKVFSGAERIGKFEKQEDILDVWFDSGVSSFAVLADDPNLAWPADIYLEGSDQHRGWFQSSLWPAVALKGRAPYNQVITHGFTLDENGQAMSKSQGNTIAPETIINKYGADILRLWVSSENYQSDIKLGWNLMNQIADSYRKIRNSFRFLLGNLFDFDEKNQVEYEKLHAMDKWALSRLARLDKVVRKAYDNAEFHQVFHALNNFFTQDMSSIYFDISKDILYVEKKEGLRRRSIQTVLYQVMQASLRLVAPVLSFTAEEIYLQFRPLEKSVHVESFWELPGTWLENTEASDIDKLLDVRDELLKVLEKLRNEKIIGKSLEAGINLKSPTPAIQALLKKYQAFLPEFFIVSAVHVSDENPEDAVAGEFSLIKAERAQGEKCPRCWYIRKELAKDADSQPICIRCNDILKG